EIPGSGGTASTGGVEGRHAVELDVLARQTSGSVGGRLGEISHRRQRNLRHHGNGRYRDAPVADVPGESGPGGSKPGPGAANGERFRLSAAGNLSGPEPGETENRAVRRVHAGAGCGLARGTRGGGRDRGSLVPVSRP